MARNRPPRGLAAEQNHPFAAYAGRRRPNPASTRLFRPIRSPRPRPAPARPPRHFRWTLMRGESDTRRPRRLPPEESSVSSNPYSLQRRADGRRGVRRERLLTCYFPLIIGVTGQRCAHTKSVVSFCDLNHAVSEPPAASNRREATGTRAVVRARWRGYTLAISRFKASLSLAIESGLVTNPIAPRVMDRIASALERDEVSTT